MNLSSCDDLTSYSESNKSVRSDKSDERLQGNLEYKTVVQTYSATSVQNRQPKWLCKMVVKRWKSNSMAFYFTFLLSSCPGNFANCLIPVLPSLVLRIIESIRLIHLIIYFR